MEAIERVGVSTEVGHTAGKIWQQLSQGGPQTLAQLKKKLNGEADLVQFAVGWLAREDKVEIVSDKRNFRVTLK
ncbi:MAG: winged helix-turn-helix domain-containing protein [Terriglobia bacterium]